MKIGALIVTTGLPRISGVTALLPEVGSISAGQRMISAFQCADVSMVGLVVGPEDKKSERQLAQNDVIFCAARKIPAFFRGFKRDFPETIFYKLRTTAQSSGPVFIRYLVSAMQS